MPPASIPEKNARRSESSRKPTAIWPESMPTSA
jgi:hypothetical protein